MVERLSPLKGPTMSIRLTLEGTIKDGVTREAFIEMARRATLFSENDEGVASHKFYLSDGGRYFEEDVFPDEAGFLSHIGPATEAGIIDEYMGSVALERVLVLDPVNDEMKAALEAWGAIHCSLVAGF
jgi:hypothetical protein